MSDYELVRNLLRIAPILIILILWILLSRRPFHARFLVVFFVGWIAIIGFTQAFWDYSFYHAPTQEIMEDVGMRDGAPRVGSIIIGWIEPLILIAVFELGRLALMRLMKARKSLSN